MVGIITGMNKEIEEELSRWAALQRKGEQGAGMTPLKWDFQGG